MTQHTFSYTATRKIVMTQADYNAILVDHKDTPQDEKDKLSCNIKAMRIIRFALPPDTFRLASACETVKEIWDRLKELYSSDADLEHSVLNKRNINDKPNHKTIHFLLQPPTINVSNQTKIL